MNYFAHGYRYNFTTDALEAFITRATASLSKRAITEEAS